MNVGGSRTSTMETSRRSFSRPWSQLGPALHGSHHLEAVGLQQPCTRPQAEILSHEDAPAHGHPSWIGFVPPVQSFPWSMAGMAMARMYMAAPSRIMNTMNGHCHGSGR